MAQSKPRRKHKSATEVTIVTEEKSTFAQAVDRFWRPVALVSVAVAAWVLYEDYTKNQVQEGHNSEWGILAAAAGTGNPEEVLKVAQTKLAGSGLEGWAALVAVSPLVSERNYSEALVAVTAIDDSKTPLLTSLSLPIGEDGAETTIAQILRQSLLSQQAQDETLSAIFTNPMPPPGSPVVEFQIAFGGQTRQVALALYAEEAPLHVENFLKLVRDGYYDGTKFHRIMKGFMVQGGDPNTKDPAKGVATWGQGGPGYKVDSETGDLVHARYVLSAAIGQGPQSNGSQFFITTGTPHHLDGVHTVFGAVLEGREVIDDLESVPIRPAVGQQTDVPEDPVPVLTSARVRAE